MWDEPTSIFCCCSSIFYFQAIDLYTHFCAGGGQIITGFLTHKHENHGMIQQEKREPCARFKCKEFTEKKMRKKTWIFWDGIGNP
jgi:hypothetical protein